MAADLFAVTQSVKAPDRGTPPGVVVVNSVTVYTHEEPTKAEHYWLLPHILCVRVDGVSIYIDVEKK